MTFAVEEFAISVERTITDTRVLVEGALDLKTGPALLDELTRQHFGVGEQIVLDLTNVDFIDSSGLVALLDVYRNYGERLRIIPNERLEPTITYTAARSFLPIEHLPTHDTAG